MKRDPWWLSVADRAYALALHVYPRAFRETWGPQMRQAMRDRWRARKRDVLDEKLLRNLHTRMFGQVWKWAGDYRKTPRNIGVDPRA